jgi:hypothetical protein
MSDDWVYSDEEMDDVAFCRKHGPTSIVQTGTFSGYSGGVCSFWKLECGCTLIDESDDIHCAE